MKATALFIFPRFITTPFGIPSVTGFLEQAFSALIGKKWIQEGTIMIVILWVFGYIDCIFMLDKTAFAHGLTKSPEGFDESLH